MDEHYHFRPARLEDRPALAALVKASVHGLFSLKHDTRQTRSALEHVFHIDPFLIEEGTYAVCEYADRIVASGGWSATCNPYCYPLAETVHSTRADTSGARPALVRAMFVQPDHARCGIGRELLRRSEVSAIARGFHSLELMTTLNGEALYRRAGFRRDRVERLTLPDGVRLTALHMSKRIEQTQLCEVA